MKLPAGIPTAFFIVVSFIFTSSISAQENPLDLASDPLQVSGVAGETGIEPLRFDLMVDHFDDRGYPENREGLLVVRSTRAGIVVPLRHDSFGALLYAQFVTRQRDAVLLAREGDFSDALPDGGEYRIPYGYGAVRMNNSYVSLVEANSIPHVSDNRKEYEVFPLQDLALGGSFGITGLSAMVRYTYTERYTVHFSLGSTVFGRYVPDSPLGFYKVPVHFGGGYRTPGLFEQFLGKNNMTFGLDFFAGFGDRDTDRSTAAFFWLPGVFVDFEKYSFGKTAASENYRTDPRPFNYHVDSVFLRIGAYINTVNPFQSGALVFSVSAGFLLDVLGPRIPVHEFKETLPVYMSREYLEDIERQKERKADREKALEAGGK